MEHVEEVKPGGGGVHNPGDPGHSRGTCYPNIPGCDASDSSDISSSKAPVTTQAQAVTTRAPGNTSGKGCWGAILKYSQRQLK